MFVSLVESGWINPTDEVAIATVRRYMAPFKSAGVDTLILGCTHFPLIAPIIQAELGETVTLIDSGRETALRCAAVLGEKDALSEKKGGRCRFFVSDRPEGFTGTAEIFLGRSVGEEVESITLEKG